MLETDSDFHKMVVSILETHFSRQKLGKVVYRDYNHFPNEIFRSGLDQELSKFDIHNFQFEQFSNIFSEILDQLTPKKSKGICLNHSSFNVKTLIN